MIRHLNSCFTSLNCPLIYMFTSCNRVDFMDSMYTSKSEEVSRKEDYMTYTETQYWNYLKDKQKNEADIQLSRDKLDQDRYFREAEQAETRRANLANEALKHESNEATIRAAELKKEGSVESSSISADASKYGSDKASEASHYATDVKRLTDQEYIANETKKIANDYEIRSFANTLEKAKVAITQDRTFAEIQKWDREIANDMERLKQAAEQLESQKALWNAQATQAEVNAKLAPINTAINGLTAVGNIWNNYRRNQITERVAKSKDEDKKKDLIRTINEINSILGGSIYG